MAKFSGYIPHLSLYIYIYIYSLYIYVWEVNIDDRGMELICVHLRHGARAATVNWRKI